MVNVSTVLNLLTCLISLVGVVPLFVYLDKLPQIAFPAALLAAFFMEKKALRPLRGMIPTVLSIVLFLFYAVRISGKISLTRQSIFLSSSWPSGC
jgi:hypothetical protein